MLAAVGQRLVDNQRMVQSSTIVAGVIVNYDCGRQSAQSQLGLAAESSSFRLQIS